MQHQLTNQEVARLRHAELLRESSRRHALNEDAPVTSATPTHGFIARVRNAFAHLPSRVPALR